MADNVRTARYATAVWSIVRDEVLRAHPWNHAAKRVILAENFLLYSEQFDNAAWTKTNASATANSVRAPDGTLTADTLTDSSASAGTVVQSVSVPNDLVTRTLSVYLKQGTALITTVMLNYSGGSVAASTSVNVTWASTPTVSTGGTISDAGNGWWRVSLSLANNGSGHTSIVATIYPSSSIAASQGTVFAWGAQLTPDSTVVGYATTTSAAIQAFTPKFGYDRGFAVPADYIRYVAQDDLELPYRVEGSTVLTDETFVEMEYISQNTDPATWDPQFVSAFAARLAAELASGITGDMGKMGAMYQIYQYRINEAQYTDSKENQQPSATIEGFSWLEARLAGVSER